MMSQVIFRMLLLPWLKFCLGKISISVHSIDEKSTNICFRLANSLKNYFSYFSPSHLHEISSSCDFCVIFEKLVRRV